MSIRQITPIEQALRHELKPLRDGVVELPEPFFGAGRYLSIAGNRDAYTESQLLDYGDRRVMAERNRCSNILCRKAAYLVDPIDQAPVYDCVNEIRKGETK